MFSLRPLLGAVALIILLGLGNLGCELDEVDPKVRDDATFQLKHMGSIGNSLTAGYQSGGLLETGQHASFPNLMSQVITGRAMQMPLIGPPGLGSESGLSPLFVNEEGDLTREPLTQPPQAMAKNLSYPLPYDNLGVPGATTHQILSTMAGAEVGNPLFDLILRNSALPGGGTCMGQLERLAPDFITAWSGHNEILGGALSGSPQSDDPGAPGYIVPVEDFEPEFVAMCDRIAALNPKVVAIANMCPITAIPYTRFFGTGSLPGINRWIMAEDLDGDDDPVQLVLLSAPISDCIQCFLPSCAFDPATPCDTIPANATLTVSEVELIDSTIADYNAVIASEVAARNWALVDAHAAFLALSNRPSADELNSAFPWQVNPISGIGVQNVQSIFSLDGVHPSEKGHAYMANKFMEAINEIYGTAYELIDIAAVQNVAGFERAPIATKMEAGFRISAEGRQGLQGMVEMMQAR